MKTNRLVVALLAASPAAAWADAALPIPEPETLALLGIGVVALLVTRYFRR